MEKTGISQKIIIFNDEGKFLTLHRTETAPSNPCKWDFPGGELGFGEDAIVGIIREAKEEAGLEIKEPKPFDVDSRITEDGSFWLTIAYKVKTDSGKIILSYEHDEFRWVDAEEFLKLDSSDKLKRFVKNLKK